VAGLPRQGRARDLVRSGPGRLGRRGRADGKLYYTSEEGDVHVVKAGPQFELLGVNRLGEVTMATPALAKGVIYFRTRDHVIAIGKR
jgi:hypothetical protein